MTIARRPAASGLSSLAGTLLALARRRPARGHRPGGRPPGARHPRIPRDRPHDDGAEKALADAGWRVHPWGLGWNSGVREDTLHKLEACVDAIGAKEPILVVGWSLGGLYRARACASRASKVRAVVTLGSPFSGDLHQNNVWRLYEWVAGHRVEDAPIPRVTEKPPVPHLAIWSRKDGIIAPRAAHGLEDERDEAVELDCSHMAFAVSRKAAEASGARNRQIPEKAQLIFRLLLFR